MIPVQPRRAGKRGRRTRERETPFAGDLSMSLSEELQKLHQLHQSGAIDEAEFTLAKAKLIGVSPEGQSFAAPPLGVTGVGSEWQDQQTRQWALFLHLSILVGLAVPVAGFVVPIIIWQLKKDELPGIDTHGKNAVNWIISKLIYAAVSIILLPLFGIGVLLLTLLGIVAVIFPIIAAIKANNGEFWKYPMAITFLH
jgi:uncharacterized Tic20 family protein